MQIVDTHQHLWDSDLFRYTWLASVPSLNRSFRMPDYLAAAKELNVVKSVHLEADVDEPYMLDETRHLLALADQPDNPLEGIVACGRPESEGFKAHLDKIAGHPRLKGIRRVLHTQPDDVGQGATFVKNVAALSGYKSVVRHLCAGSTAPDCDPISLQMPGCCFHPRPLWSSRK